MDAPAITALTALAGSVIGSITTLSASWITLRNQQRAQVRFLQMTKRQELYSSFIQEVSARLTEAWSRQAEGPAVISKLYALVAQMRLMSSENVVAVAERVVEHVLQVYAKPNRSPEEWSRSGEYRHDDPLKAFSEACRVELRAWT
jgi:hypothetical protein